MVTHETPYEEGFVCPKSGLDRTVTENPAGELALLVIPDHHSIS